MHNHKITQHTLSYFLCFEMEKNGFQQKNICFYKKIFEKVAKTNGLFGIWCP